VQVLLRVTVVDVVVAAPLFIAKEVNAGATGAAVYWIVSLTVADCPLALRTFK